MEEKKNLATTYNPKEFEERIYKTWEEKKYFTPVVDKTKKPFSIVMPPPNITGRLHLGHALDNTLQDMLIRFKRMQGYCTLWLPGQDHASIATEVKVENELLKQGLVKKEMGREAFLEKVWEWSDEYRGHIREQLKKMGVSADFSREAFTMDENLNKAVRTVFVKLYNEGLIYQGNRITNWCPKCTTALSDAEIEYAEKEGSFWHINYPLADGSGFLEIATTRPETLLGDTAVAVNPNDDRFKHLIGKTLKLPLTDREIPVVGDDYVDIEFGTGAVKITPAHDPNDFEVGKRHNLPIIRVMDDHGVINELGGKYQGLDRYEARKQMVKDLDEQGLLVKVKPHTHNVGTHDRCGTVVEPIVSKQWYVKMESLAKPAIDVVRNGKTKFVPERFDKIYYNWMENIQDWCISRQLWWGHRIPVFYCNDCNHMMVEVEAPCKCSKCGSENLRQDEDVLDTWFSSALWPMATTIWREDNEDMDKFYPTNVLVTGYDIIFFWVSRMIFQAIEFSGQKPFDDVLIHGLIRASDGRKMSKSLGNGIDPMDVIESHGADALRLFLIGNSAPGLDLRYSEEKLDASWNFLNKVWNVTRFVLQNTQNIDDLTINESLLDDADYYIIKQYNEAVEKINYYMDKYEFGEVSKYLINFIRDEFSSWYLEIAKIYFNQEDEVSTNKKKLLKSLLINSIKLMHPFTPFISDEIYSAITNEEIYDAHWPEVIDFNDQKALERFNLIKDMIINIRNFREQNEISVKQAIDIIIESEEDLSPDYDIIKRLANVNQVLTNVSDQNVVSFVYGNASMHIINENLVDEEKQQAKLQQQLDHITDELNRSIKMLSNQNFVSKANPDKIKEEVDKAKTNILKYKETVELMCYNDTNNIVEELEGIINNL